MVQSENMLLAGDVGGTKTHLALFHPEHPRQWVRDQLFKSRDSPDLETIIESFLGKDKVSAACIGVAGPVKEGVCKATNLPWVVSAHTLSSKLDCPHISLINDLEANAYGIESLEDHEFFVLQQGKEGQKGNRALIAAGTGLGEAGWYRSKEGYVPFATEGGHTSFAPENDQEIELLRFLKPQFEHVSFERVLSGPGLHHIYRFFLSAHPSQENGQVKERLAQEDPAKVIHQMSKECKLCRQAVDCFIAIYGSEAGNLALKMLALGGVYLGGGMAPKMISDLSNGAFAQRFSSKGRFAPLLASIPIKVVMNENTALIGAARYARKNG